jgi:hypothetical protein
VGDCGGEAATVLDDARLLTRPARPYFLLRPFAADKPLAT